MKKPSSSARALLSNRAGNGLEQLAQVLASYAVLLLLALITVFAVVRWAPAYNKNSAQAVPMRAGQLSADGPVEAFAALTQVAPANYWDTQLSELPVWFSLHVPAAPAGTQQDRKLEFPSRHAIRVQCFAAASGNLLGDARRYQSSGALAALKTGFVLDLPDGRAEDIVCKTSFVGPAHLTAEIWSDTSFRTSLRTFDRTLGLLDGGLTLISIFLLLTAVINRRLLFAVFAAWLILAVRLGSLSLGMDLMWAGHLIPASLLPLSRAVTISFYALSLLTLYRLLFKEDLVGTVYNNVMRWLQGVTLLLVAAAFALPYRQFLPLMWTVGGVILVVMCASLFNIVRRTRSRVALWYSGALAVAAFANLVEIWAAASGQRELIGYVNSVTAALASCLLASLALAEQMRQEHLQRIAAQAELLHTFEATPIGLFTLDLRGKFLSTNPALRRMLDVPAGATPQQRALWSEHFEAGAWPRLQELASRQAAESEMEVRGATSSRGGSPRTYLVKATVARGKFEGSLQDVTEKSLAAENMQFLVNHDSLTKVLNRRGIEAALQAGLKQLAQESSGPGLAVAHFDLDRFKLLNDLFGHAAGDEVLRQVCKRAQAELQHGMQFGRVGADEFVVVMPKMSMASAAELGQRLLAALGTTAYQVGEQAFLVRVSIGVVEVATTLNLQEVLLTADRACQQAKARQRGNGLLIFDKNAAIFREHSQELHLIAELAAGTIVEHLFLAMQPIMSLQAPDDALNFEVLLRMRDAGGAIVPTPLLIAAAESSGHIGVIDRWVLSTTLAWMDAHRVWLAKTQFICLNLSGASLNDERFLAFVFDALSRSPESAARLCFEITESVALHDLENTRRFIEQVRSYGARVALDDFGAGYTSFVYLRELPADVLKIDGNFVVNMNQHPANVAIVEAIVSLARNLGMKTIAEWAEDADTVRTLVGLGVDYVQGYVIARPRQPEEILAAPSAAAFVEDDAMSCVLRDLRTRTSGTAAAALDVFANPTDPAPEVH